MRLFDKLLNRKIKGRLETDDGINAENVIKKSNNIQTVVSYENDIIKVDREVIIKDSQIRFLDEGNSSHSNFKIYTNYLESAEPTEIADYGGEPYIALILSAGGGVAVVSSDGTNGTTYIINADSNITITAGGVINITAVNDSYVSTLIIAR